MSIINNGGYIPHTLTTTSIRFPDPLTIEEKKRLDELESQMKTHIKFEQIKKFKQMPSHLRQEIVDEAYIRDITNSLNTSDCEDSFEFREELKQLRNKKANSGYITVGGDFTFGSLYGGKYSSILSKFTTEELAKAHAEVCLEEGLNN